jgi:hypothetical protein
MHQRVGYKAAGLKHNIIVIPLILSIVLIDQFIKF